MVLSGIIIQILLRGNLNLNLFIGHPCQQLFLCRADGCVGGGRVILSCWQQIAGRDKDRLCSSVLGGIFPREMTRTQILIKTQILIREGMHLGVRTKM